MIAQLAVTILVAMTAALASGTSSSLPPGAPDAKPTAPVKTAKANTEADKKPQTTTHHIPDWAYDARWYQLDIARFRYADPEGKPGSAKPRKVGTTYRVATENGTDFRTVVITGNIAGLNQELDYLTELGVNTLYLVPIFRYMLFGAARVPTDIRHVDDKLGDEPSQHKPKPWDAANWKLTAPDRLFIDFIKAAHQRKFRVVLSIPHYHEMRVNSDKEAERRLFDTTRRWMDPNSDGNPSDGIDGWIVHEPGLKGIKAISFSGDFSKRWRHFVKKLNPNALLIANVVRNTTNWVGRDRFDVAIDRETSNAIQRLISEPRGAQPLKQFAESVTALWQNGPSDKGAWLSLIFDAQRGRLIEALMPTTPDGAIELDNPSDPESSQRKKSRDARWRLGMILHYFLPGAPLIYYGEEVGVVDPKIVGQQIESMWWADGPSTPKGYRPDFASLVQWLNFRRSLLAPLRRGSVRTIMADDKTGMLVIARTLPDGEVILAMNLSKTKRQVAVPAGKPGELAHILTPELVPSGRPVPRFPGRKQAKVEQQKKSWITPLRLGGCRQFVSAKGTLSIWVGPQAIRVILLGSAAPSQ